MKVLLLNPPTIDEKQFIREGRCTQEQGVWATLWPPLSLATIGAVLEEDGVVKIVDCPARKLLESINTGDHQIFTRCGYLEHRYPFDSK